MLKMDELLYAIIGVKPGIRADELVKRVEVQKLLDRMRQTEYVNENTRVACSLQRLRKAGYLYSTKGRSRRGWYHIGIIPSTPPDDETYRALREVDKHRRKRGRPPKNAPPKKRGRPPKIHPPAAKKRVKT